MNRGWSLFLLYLNRQAGIKPTGRRSRMSKRTERHLGVWENYAQPRWRLYFTDLKMRLHALSLPPTKINYQREFNSFTSCRNFQTRQSLLFSSLALRKYRRSTFPRLHLLVRSWALAWQTSDIFPHQHSLIAPPSHLP